MEEYVNIDHGTRVSTKETTGKSSKRKSRDLPLIGGLAATEGSIWQRSRQDTAPKTRESEQRAIEPKEINRADKPNVVPVAVSEHEQFVAEAEEDERLSALTPDELKHIAEEYVETRTAELAEEASQDAADPERRAATEADAELMDKLREKLAADNPLPPQMLAEEAYRETAQSFSEPSPQQGIYQNNPPPVPASLAGSFGAGPNMPPQISESVAEKPAYSGDTVTRAEAAYYERQAENRGLLVGGIVGYLVGRRRGRIKTEKRLLPIQHKLEKQVIELHRSIADKEREIRTVAAQKARREAAPKTEPERPPLPRANTYVLSPQPAAAAERPAATTEVIAPPPAEIHSPKPAFTVPELQPLQPERQAEQSYELSDRDTLELSKKIVIDGTSLHSVYEAKRVTEPGLKRVVHEHLRGGDVKKVLERELLIKELTYERDPQVRHGVTAAFSPAAAQATPLPPPSPQPSLSSMPSFGSDPGQAAAPKKPVSPASHPSGVPEQAIMRAWVAVMVLLAVIAVVLILR